ncbi:MAG: calcium/sodium antiporter [Gemmatimonadales bacterium]|nr:calcium/sodium antiporter [Gemmatimonadales bacterium]
MTPASAALLLGGLVVLVVGGEVLVRGAGGVARALGMSPLLVGLTVVAFATSAPELAVSLKATLGGTAGLAVGNVVGSNIANILLVLGASAVILPVRVESRVLRRDVPVVVGLSGLVLGMSLDARISRAEGALLLVVLAAYVVGTVLAARHAASHRPTDHRETTATPAAGMLRDLLLVGLGVAFLVVGADWLVDGASRVARSFGITDLVIGLTVVAVGTSLPELVTSIIAALRSEQDIAVGNVVGSSVVNLGGVLGLCALLAADGIPIEPAAVRFDLPFMVATAIALLPAAFTGLAIARWEGAVFVAYYAAYLAYLVLTATSHPALPAFSAAMRIFVIPLTLITAGVLVGHQLHRRRAAAS